MQDFVYTPSLMVQVASHVEAGEVVPKTNGCVAIVSLVAGWHMVSITWHTKNTPPKQPFCHTHLVVPCAHGI